MEFFQKIKTGALDLKVAGEMAQRLRQRMRFKNFVIRTIWDLNNSSENYNDEPITYKWLHTKNFINLDSLEEKYFSFFQKNHPSSQIASEVTTLLRRSWQKFIRSEGKC